LFHVFKLECHDWCQTSNDAIPHMGVLESPVCHNLSCSLLWFVCALLYEVKAIVQQNCCCIKLAIPRYPWWKGMNTEAANNEE
jgi:hypothetical protein